MDRFLEAIARDPDDFIVPVFMFSAMFIIGLVAVIGGFITTVITTRQREQTRREIAAYVAEGSMPPEVAERMLTAEPPRPKKKGCC